MGAVPIFPLSLFSPNGRCPYFPLFSPIFPPIIMRKAMGLIALNMNAIEHGLSQYAQKHPDQQELIAELRSEITAHKPKILLILANLNDKIVTKTGDQPEKPIAQSLALNKKGILVASIGDLTGLLSGSYESIYYYINDHIGTPRMLTDSSAIVVWSADYDPFGKATVNDDPDGNGTHVTNNIRFPGQYYDSETALHYNYHRYYDPGIGRYLSPDPVLQLQAGVDSPEVSKIPYLLPYMLESPLELHNYVYVQNNSLRYGDPKGLYCGPGKYEKYINNKPGGCDFTKCCKFHDDCYDPSKQQCGENRSPRSECDTEFLKCMLITNLKYDCIKWALLYYFATAAGGAAFY